MALARRWLAMGIAGLVLNLLGGATAQAQDWASLLADDVTITTDGRLSAVGNVEVLYGGQRLSAQAISYDSKTRELIIQGPIRLTDPATGAVFVATQAELSANLQEGILLGARMVLDQQLQLAAAEIRRVEGRYTQLYKVVASTCQVCAGNPTPLWQIRAQSVIHDPQTERIYFRNARIDVAGQPIFFLPRLSLPQPGTTRATGFLVPKFQFSGALGAQFAQPYFITLGDHADLTFTPLASEAGVSLGARYRRAFRQGDIVLEGALSQDNLGHPNPRGYLYADAKFVTIGGLNIKLGAEIASDRDYLSDYGIPGAAELVNEVSLSRVGPYSRFRSELIATESLRASEVAYADTLPSILFELDYDRRFDLDSVAGGFEFGIDADAHIRRSTVDGTGRDVARLAAGLEWNNAVALASGVVLESMAGADVEVFAISDDASFAALTTQLRPALGARLRWPWIRQAGTGAVTLIEPVAQLGWAGTSGGAVPNEDSLLNEFDTGNLFSLSHYVGQDASETGWQAAAGVIVTHDDASNASWTLTLARVFFETAQPGFGAASGLSGTTSDWLVGAAVDAGGGLQFDSRALIDDAGSVTNLEARASWDGPKLSINLAHSQIVADPLQNRASTIAVASLNGTYKFNRHWSADFDLSGDLDLAELREVGVDLSYMTECIQVDVSLSHQFESSVNVKSGLDFGLEVQLVGFGTDGRAHRRACF